MFRYNCARGVEVASPAKVCGRDIADDPVPAVCICAPTGRALYIKHLYKGDIRELLGRTFVLWKERNRMDMRKNQFFVTMALLSMLIVVTGCKKEFQDVADLEASI
ncbi:MAG: hypothetical protein AAF570_03220, partial [Bacteroidota bacterium]